MPKNNLRDLREIFAHRRHQAATGLKATATSFQLVAVACCGAGGV